MVLQRIEMVMRIAEEIEALIIELGVDGRLVRLQLEEVMGGVEDERRLVVRDYFHEDAQWHLDEAMAALAQLETDDLLDLKSVAEMLHLPMGVGDLDASLQAKGYRLLAKIPRLPDQIVDHIVERFGNLGKIMRATIDDLDDVEGVGEARAKSIKEGLSRLAESSILDRYS
jgi:diadenylate cyclase